MSSPSHITFIHYGYWIDISKIEIRHVTRARAKISAILFDYLFNLSNILRIMDIKIVSEEQTKDIIELMKLYYDFYEVSYPSNGKLYNLISKLFGGTDHGVQFLAYEKEIPIGFATLYFTLSTFSASQISVMNDLYVKPDWRGKDVAKQLFDSCVRYSRENGYSKMEWITAKDNYRGQGFYDKMGGSKTEWIFYNISTD